MTWSGVVEPDYFQFYARRAGAEWLPDVIDDEVYRDHLWTDGAFVVITTARKFGTTPLTLDVLPNEPGPPAPQWQHVAEVSQERGGPLEILSWLDEGPRSVHDVPAEPVRLRVHWAELVPDRFEGLDDLGNSEEHLALVVWPAPMAPPNVLRRWDWWRY